MPDDIAQAVLETLASVKKIPKESIQLEDTLESLRIDSLDRITLLFELEKVFDLNIPDESAQSIRTVADIVEGIHKLQECRSARGLANGATASAE
jgi:acyl carrier protein